MPKTVTQTQFDHFVSQQLWPLFKARGYRKTGNNFRSYAPSGWGKIVNLQKSQYGDRDNIRFTLNTGLYLAEADRLFWGERRPIAGERFLEPDCLVRQRLDALGGSQQWYELNDLAKPVLLLTHVQEQVVRYVLPYLDRIVDRDTILQQILQERFPNSPLAIKTLFVCGYQQQAREWIEQELASTLYRRQRESMQVLQAELEALD